MDDPCAANKPAAAAAAAAAATAGVNDGTNNNNNAPTDDDSDSNSISAMNNNTMQMELYDAALAFSLHYMHQQQPKDNNDNADNKDNDDDSAIIMQKAILLSLKQQQQQQQQLDDDDDAFATMNELKGAAAAFLQKYDGHDDQKPAAKSDITKAVANSSLSNLDRWPQDRDHEMVARSSTTCPHHHGIVASLPPKRAHDDNDDNTFDDDDQKPPAKRDITDTADGSLSEQEIDANLDMDAALALSLQAKEWGSLNGSPTMYDSDHGILQAVAKAPQVVHTAPPAPNGVQSGNARRDLDKYLAMEHSKEKKEIAVSTTFCSKAYKFVESVADAYQLQISKCNNSCDDVVAGTEASAAAALQMKLIASDDMLPMVERFVEAQAVFQFGGKDLTVDIGYHFTRSENLLHIQKTGLLSKGERREKGIESNCNGSSWGDGIYTGSNPHAYSHFGDIGLLVARLRGNSMPATTRGQGFKGNTRIVDEGSSKEMVILGQSFQCIPLLQFRHHVSRDAATSDKTIWAFHCMLQDIIDTFFNNGNRTGLDKAQPPSNWTFSRKTPLRVPGPAETLSILALIFLTFYLFLTYLTTE